MCGLLVLLFLTLSIAYITRYRRLGDVIGYANADSVYLITITRFQPEWYRPPWNETPQFFTYPFALHPTPDNNQVLSAELGETIVTKLLNLRVRPWHNQARGRDPFVGYEYFGVGIFTREDIHYPEHFSIIQGDSISIGNVQSILIGNSRTETHNNRWFRLHHSDSEVWRILGKLLDTH